MIIATTPHLAERETAQTLGVENGMSMVSAAGAAVKLR
jgi:uncharacterized protein YbjQ (UPF0145 family)